MTRHLVVFAKPPRIGRVKTRLANEIGPVLATRLARTLLIATVRRLAPDPRWQLWLAVPGAARADALPRQLRALPRLSQGPGDLGRKMGRLLSTGPRALPPGPVLIVGSDIPALNTARIARAFAELAKADIVLGPAADGGYWALGRSARTPFRAAWLSGVRWSTARAMEDTLAALPQDLHVGFARPGEDIDDGAGYRRWRRCVAFIVQPSHALPR